jgi:hypothetical protein
MIIITIAMNVMGEAAPFRNGVEVGIHEKENPSKGISRSGTPS